MQDDTMPQWNESENFVTMDASTDLIRVDAYNENRTKEDEYIGSAEYPVNKLLRKRFMEMELKTENKSTGSFITLKCAAVSAVPESDPSVNPRQSLETIGENTVSLPSQSIPRYKYVRRKINNLPKISNARSLRKSLPMPSRRRTVDTRESDFGNRISPGANKWKSSFRRATSSKSLAGGQHFQAHQSSASDLASMGATQSNKR